MPRTRRGLDADEREDENSVEGAITRSLFRTGSSSSDSDEDNSAPFCLNALAKAQVSPDFVERSVMDISLVERQIGSSIAEQVWPAAQYLAQFVMDVSSGITPRETASTNNPHAWEALVSMLRSDRPLKILELGAGVGLTGLQLATRLNVHVTLTDLPEAMPLLKRNIELNRSKFLAGRQAVTTQVVSWGNDDVATDITEGWNDSSSPVLILASDCVYFSELHLRLEQTLAALLKNSPPRSLCLIAGARRWKRDTKFYSKLGKATRTTTHSLSCTLLEETVTRIDARREIMRVYSVQWVPT